MKKAFSRLITFINHLLAYLVSTLVERWLSKHATTCLIYRLDSACDQKVGLSSDHCVVIGVDGTDKSIVITPREEAR